MKRRNFLKTERTGILLIIILLAAVISISYFGLSGRERKSVSGIPDAVSSIVDGKSCRLTVVANRDAIGNRKKFAEELIQMCRENSFRSIQISTDIYGWPVRLEMDVYLHKNEIHNGRPVMHIRYEPLENNGSDCDIRCDADQYRLIME